MTFSTREKKKIHEDLELCIPEAERRKNRKNRKKEAVGDSKKEEKDPVDLEGQTKKMNMVGLQEQAAKLLAYILFDKSVNDDHERSILSQLKQQCGGQFTSKMGGMASPNIDLALTTGFWPSYKSFDLNLSAEMVKCVEVFKEFYNINGLFDKKTIDFIVTTYQIPLPPVDEMNVIEDFDKDGRYAIDASIVRIMKSCKVLGRPQFVMECVEQLSRMFKASPNIDLAVTVLTTGFWPSYKSFDLNLPAEMVKCVEVFKEFYNINGQFDQKTREFIVTTYQIPLPPVEEMNVIEDGEQLVMECVEQLSHMFKADFKVLVSTFARCFYKSTKVMVPSLVTNEI